MGLKLFKCTYQNILPQTQCKWATDDICHGTADPNALSPNTNWKLSFLWVCLIQKNRATILLICFQIGAILSLIQVFAEFVQKPHYYCVNAAFSDTYTPNLAEQMSAITATVLLTMACIWATGSNRF